MDSESYWYYANGRVKSHMIPPTDPSTTSFIKLDLHDIGYGKVKATLTPCKEGKYLHPVTVYSESRESPRFFRERIEDIIKKNLQEQRQITEWGSQERKIKHKKQKIKRKCKK